MTEPVKFKAIQPVLTVISGAALGLCVAITSVGAGALGSVMMMFLYPLRMTPPSYFCSRYYSCYSTGCCIWYWLSFCGFSGLANVCKPFAWLYTNGYVRVHDGAKSLWSKNSSVSSPHLIIGIYQSSNINFP